MTGPDCQHVAYFEQVAKAQLAADFGIGGRAADDEIDLARHQPLDHEAGVAFQQPDLHVRPLPVEAADRGGDVTTGHRLAEADRDAAAARVAQQLHLAHHAVGHDQLLTCACQQETAEHRQRQTSATRTLEEPDPGSSLHLGDARAQALLRDLEHRRGVDERAAIDDGQEAPELAEFDIGLHRKTSISCFSPAYNSASVPHVFCIAVVSHQFPRRGRMFRLQGNSRSDTCDHSRRTS